MDFLLFFSGLIVVLDILIPVYILLYFVAKKQKKGAVLVNFFKLLSANYLSLSFLVSMCAVFGSLFLSEVAKYPPCELCWYQRIFMFPQPVILGIAMFKNDQSARIYSVALALIGFVIAVYHILIQNGQLIFPCSNQAVNCSVKQFVYFGYVTIPVMSATAFVLLILLALPAIIKKKNI